MYMYIFMLLYVYMYMSMEYVCGVLETRQAPLAVLGLLEGRHLQARLQQPLKGRDGLVLVPPLRLPRDAR